MKAFRKWASPGFNWGNDPSNRPGLDQAQRGWRAALKEVLKQIDESKYQYPEIIIDWIKEELKDE